MITFSDTSAQEPITITVRSLRAQHDGAEILVGVVLESGEHREQRNLLLTTEQYCELRPTRGEIDESLFERLEAASDLCRAIRCGENLLSYGANSVQMLTQKIVRHGFRRDVALAAAEKLCEVGLIDENEDMRREVEKCLRKLWGAKRIQAHLWSRGFDAGVMASLDSLLADVDFVANCAALIRKHYVALPQDAAEERRMVSSLGRYGYTLTQIRQAMRRISENLDGSDNP
ncbi:MAG: RecX family transcriptional regulator [Ruminococcaceae bacterium]|nr:RecX family transcriptional regulator [Oscillospiraceae bacterium]